MSKQKRKIYIVEDKRVIREHIGEKIDEMGIFDEIIYCKDRDDFTQKYSVNGFLQVGLLDINLSHAGDPNKAGLDCCRQMRDSNPKAYIMTYSGGSMLKDESFAAGANEFFDKKPEKDETDDMYVKIKELVSNHFNFIDEGLSGYKIKYEIKSIITEVSIEDKVVTLQCFSEKDSAVFTKDIPIDDFSHISEDDLAIDTSVLILIMQNDNGENIRKIKKSEIDYSVYFDVKDDFDEIPSKSLKDLSKSRIFKK